MSEPTTLDISFYAGTSRTLNLSIVDGVGTAVDITGLTGSDINYVLQAGQYDRTDHTYKDLTSGIVITSATNGDITVSVDPADTSSVVFGSTDLTYYHQLEVTVATKPDVCMIGDVTLKKRAGQSGNIILGGDATGNTPVVTSSHQLAYDLPVGSLTLA